VRQGEVSHRLERCCLFRVPVNSISKNLHGPEEPLTPSKYVQDGPKAGSDSGLESYGWATKLQPRVRIKYAGARPQTSTVSTVRVQVF